jgi:hypothetical protein
VSKEIANRLGRIFQKDEDGRRPVYGGTEKFQSDSNWRDHILFYEYFHGDNGAGLGASHQTGWTWLVAKTIHSSAILSRINPYRWEERRRLFPDPERNEQQADWPNPFHL